MNVCYRKAPGCFIFTDRYRRPLFHQFRRSLNKLSFLQKLCIVGLVSSLSLALVLPSPEEAARAFRESQCLTACLR